jgi:hypothetical protein
MWDSFVIGNSINSFHLGQVYNNFGNSQRIIRTIVRTSNLRLKIKGLQILLFRVAGSLGEFNASLPLSPPSMKVYRDSRN